MCRPFSYPIRSLTISQPVFVTLQVTEPSAAVPAGTLETHTGHATEILVQHLHAEFRLSVKIKEGDQILLFSHRIFRSWKENEVACFVVFSQ